MRRAPCAASHGVGGLVLVFLATACGTSRGVDERTAVTIQAIQDGVADTSDQYSFVVAVFENSQQAGLCSGSLLAPNLVATARHCVTALSGPKEIDCAASTFGSDLPVGDLLVTNDAKLSSETRFVGVSRIVVPTGAQQTKVCGNDIALLILDQNIALSQYVVPAINPPMSDPRYSISVTAIGYGIDSPLDTTGMTAGIRRVRENVRLACVPNDPSFLGCYDGPIVSEFLAPDEFVSGDASTCDGDSGSGAFDQGSFDRGAWVSFGVLSRGAVDADSGTCVQPIYSRFDAWAQLLVDGVTQAAALGGYALPPWALSAASSDASVAGSEHQIADATADSLAGPGDGATVLRDGMPCGADAQCGSRNCVSTDDVNFLCASPCTSGVCAAGFSCVSAFCFPATSNGAPTTTVASHGSGCSIATIAPKFSGDPFRGVAAVLLPVFVCLGRRARASRSPNEPPRRRDAKRAVASTVGIRTGTG
jgi:Trypsin